MSDGEAEVVRKKQLSEGDELHFPKEDIIHTERMRSGLEVWYVKRDSVR